MTKGYSHALRPHAMAHLATRAKILAHEDRLISFRLTQVGPRMISIPRLSAALLLAVVGIAQAQAPRPDSAKKKDLPLAAARTIDIDTDEGSWISVDISPDGKTLVFDLLGDIYSLPMTGGAATAITTGMAFDGQPRYSPDGKWIAFTSDKDGAENVWIMNLETKELRQITKLRDKTLQ